MCWFYFFFVWIWVIAQRSLGAALTAATGREELSWKMLSNALQHPRVAGVMGTLPLQPVLSERGREDKTPHLSLISAEGASWALPRPLPWLPSITAFQTFTSSPCFMPLVWKMKGSFFSPKLSAATQGEQPQGLPCMYPNGGDSHRRLKSLAACCKFCSFWAPGFKEGAGKSNPLTRGLRTSSQMKPIRMAPLWTLLCFTTPNLGGWSSETNVDFDFTAGCWGLSLHLPLWQKQFGRVMFMLVSEGC